MHPRTRELLGYLDEQRAALRAAYDALPVGARGVSPEPNRWSAVQIVEHVAIVEQGIAGLLVVRIADARAARIGGDPDTTAILPSINLVARVLDRSTHIEAPKTASPRGASAVEAWAALERSGELLRGAIRDGDGLALAVVAAPHPVFGPLSLYEWIAFAGAHEARHAAQIREMAGQLT